LGIKINETNFDVGHDSFTRYFQALLVFVTLSEEEEEEKKKSIMALCHFFYRIMAKAHMYY
jgi:hypothetical protein